MRHVSGISWNRQSVVGFLPLHKVRDMFFVLLQDIGVRLQKVNMSRIVHNIGACLGEQQVDESAGNKEALDLNDRFRIALAPVHVHLVSYEQYGELGCCWGFRKGKIPRSHGRRQEHL